GGTWYSGQFAAITQPSLAPMARWVDEIPNDGLIYYRFMFNADRVLLCTPQAIGEVLVTKSYEFIKPSFLRAGIAQILGMGILLAEGEEHKVRALVGLTRAYELTNTQRQRKLLMPAFSHRHVKDLIPTFWEKSQAFVNGLTREVETLTNDSQPPVLNIAEFSSRATLDIIGSAGMGHDFNSIENPHNELARKYRELFEPTASARLLGIIGFILPGVVTRALPVKRNDTIREGAATIRRICREIIKETKAKLNSAKERSKDIVSIAIESAGFSDEELVDQMMTFLAAGHETTATAMVWALYELCRNFENQTRLRQEIRANLPSLDSPDFHLNGTPDKLPLLHAVCNEVLRVHPPVGLTLREAAVNTSIQGQYIPAGTKIILAPAATNVSTKLWGEDAKAFRPERWLQPGQTNSGGAASNYSFLTFLHGPRSCIGQQFARAEFAALLAAMIGRFEIELAQPEKGINIQAGLTSRPEGGLPVRIKVVEGW
ncbi:MAG: hypothetical protein Q9174_007226, partial [Haloplaca sp. 1 TL-2023]